jgi:membrane associated rhomboid family serine protease
MLESLFAGVSLSATPVTVALLIVNIGASLFTLLAAPDLIGRYSMRPYAIVRGEWDRSLTGSFLHGGFWHLAFNMWALLLFGALLEGQVFGPVKFAILYFGSDLCASGLSIWRHKDDPQYSAVGASGAISGVILSYCLFAPLSQLYVFFVPMPAIVFAALYIGGSTYMMRKEGGARGGIAHEAHLGGALGGIVLTLILEPRAAQIFWTTLFG